MLPWQHKIAVPFDTQLHHPSHETGPKMDDTDLERYPINEDYNILSIQGSSFLPVAKSTTIL